MTISVNLPDELLEGSTEEFMHELRLAGAVKLFELGKVSSGKAAELAGVPRVAFLEKLAEFGVSPFQITPEELQEEVRIALEHRNE